MVGLLVGAAAFLLMPSIPTAAGLILAMVLLGGAGAADSVAPGAILGDVVAGRGGTVVAVFQMSGDLGAVLGPVVAGCGRRRRRVHRLDGTLSAAVCAAPIAAVAAAPETLRRPAAVSAT